MTQETIQTQNRTIENAAKTYGEFKEVLQRFQQIENRFGLIEHDLNEIALAILDMGNGMESGIETFRQRMKQLKLAESGQSLPLSYTWNIENIRWTEQHGAKGPFDVARPEDNVDGPDFKALMSNIQKNGGKMTKEGHFFSIMQDGVSIGMWAAREKGAKTSAQPQEKLPESTSQQASNTAKQFQPGNEDGPIRRAQLMFPEDIENRLSFEEQGDYVIIKPKQFLGSESFAKIALTVRGAGGEYISAGKDSHFRIHKTST